MSIKYYQLAEGEELPDEFCAVRDVDGEPSDYTFYVHNAESYELLMRTVSLEAALEGMHLIREQDMAENDKLRSQCAGLVDERERLFRANVKKNGEMLRLVGENAKLRELVRLLLWGVDNDMPRYEELAWSQRVNVLVRELRIEADE